METPADHLRKRIEKRARRGFCGYPVATIAYYGPSDKTASKVVVGIVHHEHGDANPLQRWYSEDVDVRKNADGLDAICDFVQSQGALTVAVTPGIWGCPHEEGIDYPTGTVCPKCPFWANRDRDQIFGRPGGVA